MQNIWIINHYSYRGRHYKLAEKLVKSNYNVRIICASTSNPKNQKQFSDKRQIRHNENIKGVLFTYIKARDYIGNGKGRIKNMLEFSYRAYKSMKKERKARCDLCIICPSFKLGCRIFIS